MKALASLLKDHNKKNDKKQKDNDSGSSTPGTTTDSKRSKVKPSKQPEKVPAQPQQFKPSAKTMPNIVFLPHSTEISTIRPSVSGRLLLQIPRVPGFKFHFVSLALHLKLKESISWTRQDLVSFEIEKHHWGQTVWEKKLMLEFQDKQVEEAKEIGLGTGGKTEATVEDHNTLPHGNAVSSHLDTKPDVPLATPDLIDEWRWEWFMAVTKNEARPESFEGSMGCVWYELEAKCLFRWDSVDKDGNVINPIVDQQPSTDASGKSSTGNASPSSKGTDSSQGKSQSGSSKLLKSLGVLGKLRVGNKSKKPQYAGDFKMPSQHEEYFKNSLKTGAEGGVSPGISTQSSSTKPPSTAMALFSLAFGRDDDEPEPPTNVSRTTPVPFQIRKSLKLYFTRPALRVSSNPAFFLPPPSMSLPTLPSTRRLKAIIPGARIQVQIQVPSIVPIPGYAYTSLLVPCPKTGSLIPIKSMNNPNTSVTARLAGGCHGHIQASGNAIITGAHPEGSYIRPRFGDNRLYPEDFQVALTVRKVTQYDINKCNILKRRYENAEAVANAANHHAGSPPTGGMSQGPYALRRLLSQQSGSSYTSGPDTATTEEPSDASGITGSTDSGQRQDRSWRKEIRVRHVKCEFWQKENCRIPTMDAPSRAIKTPLGSPFTYTEKENEKERQRTTSGTEADGLSPYTVPSSREETTTSTSNYSKSLSPNFLAVDDASSSSYSSGRETPFKPTTTSPLAQSPLSQQLRTVPNKPFMLLIPVPLDSPRIRQTYTWPSPESLSGYDASESILTDSSGFGYGSDLEYRSQGSMSEMTSGGSFSNWEGSRAYGGGSGVAIVGGYGNNNHLSSGTKARIEAKHYLTFRLSIDILEYEGELEQEDVDLEAIEEQQLLQAQSRQMFTSEPVNSTSGDYSDHSRFTSLRQPITSTLSPSDPLEHRHSSKISPPTSPMIPLSVGSAGHLMTATSATSATSATVSSTGVLTSSGGANLPTIEPALNFLNSTEDLLSADMDSDIGSGPGSVGMTYDLSKRRGSRSSETTTVKSGVSGNSGSTRSGGNAHTTSSSSISGGSSFMSSSVSIPMSGSDHGVKGTGHGGGSLMAGALGVLKKRGSSSTLPQQMHSSQQQQQQQQQQQKRLNRVNVQKLKDFVIRVPITIVLQGDEWDQGTNEPGNLTSSSAPPWQQNQYQSSRTRPVVNPSADTSSSLGSGTRSTDDFTSASSSSSLFLAGLKHHQGPPLRYGVGESITKTSQVEEEEVEGEFAVVDAEDDD
ncbi:hypothetical protein BGX31_010488 [Mortierella sp. GBA43]|nr:hypothetical protein BGX31_010488 [Mortierella sp. GBA43]